jgi:ABC-type polysaccharide/polyol phosphate export permease
VRDVVAIDAATGSARPRRTYRAGSRVGAVAAWRELWAGRDIVRAFVVRAIRLRYRQAVLGIAWAVIQPLALLVPITLFLRDGTPRIDGVPFAASTLAALVAWSYLSTAVTTGSGALVTEAVLVRKTWFPREAPVVAAVISALVELGFGTVLALAAMPLLDGELGVGLLAAPIAIAGLAVVALTLSLPLAALNALFRDVRHALPFGVLVWLFASPVMYPVTRLPDRWQPWYALANPAVGPTEAYRRAVAHGTWPAWDLLGLSILGALLLGAAGHAVFRRIAPTLPDVI